MNGLNVIVKYMVFKGLSQTAITLGVGVVILHASYSSFDTCNSNFYYYFILPLPSLIKFAQAYFALGQEAKTQGIPVSRMHPHRLISIDTHTRSTNI